MFEVIAKRFAQQKGKIIVSYYSPLKVEIPLVQALRKKNMKPLENISQLILNLLASRPLIGENKSIPKTLWRRSSGMLVGRLVMLTLTSSL